MWNAGVRVFDVRDPSHPVEVAYYNPGDVHAGPEVVLDQAWGHIRWVPETGHLWYASANGGFWVLELEPQVRSHLGLDGEGAPPVRDPDGAPGTGGVQLLSEIALDDQTWRLSCTLAPVQSVAGSVPLEVSVDVALRVATAFG
jgi:hypothetical protein